MKGIGKRVFIIQMIGIVVARAAFLGMNPLAIGYFTAAYLENAGKGISLFVILIGIASVLKPIGIFRYLLAMVSSTVILEIPAVKKLRIPQPILYAIPPASLCIFTLLEMAADGFANGEAIMAALEAVIAYVFAIVFKNGIAYIMHTAKGYKMNNEQMVSMAVMVAAVIYAVPEVNITYFAPMETIIYFLILFFTYKYGVGQGAVTGAVCGLAAGLRGAPVSDIGLYSILGIVPAGFREMGRLPIATVYIATAAIMDMLYEGMELSVSDMGALGSAVTLFLLLPGSLVYRVDSSTRLKIDLFNSQNLKSIAKSRMKVFSESFLKLSEALGNISMKQTKLRQQEINRIFEDISERFCKDCENCKVCWGNNYDNTYQAACKIFELAEKNGRIDKEDIPVIFHDGCISADEFIEETNRGFEIAKLNQIWNNRLAESREIIAEQLREISSAIQDISGDLYGTTVISRHDEDRVINHLKAIHIYVRNISVIERSNKRKEIYINAACKSRHCVTTREVAGEISDVLGVRFVASEASKTVMSKETDSYAFIEDTKFKVLTGIARAMKENISGDNFSLLKLDTGEIMIAISDGMGTGNEASEESETVMALLEQMIEAGFKPESAIKLINSNIVLKADEQTFSTLDMGIIDLYTGICRFIKLGAAATFIKRNKWVETISSTTLPIGILNSVDYDTVSKKLYEGDIIIMVTDGVLDCIKEVNKEACLEKWIQELDSSNPQEIANRILDRTLSERNYIPKDDMTVITAGIWFK